MIAIRSIFEDSLDLRVGDPEKLHLTLALVLIF